LRGVDPPLRKIHLAPKHQRATFFPIDAVRGLERNRSRVQVEERTGRRKRVQDPELDQRPGTRGIHIDQLLPALARFGEALEFEQAVAAVIQRVLMSGI
jgi:hypothetical protein